MSVGEIISLMSLLYQLSAIVGSVLLISNNLPFLALSSFEAFIGATAAFSVILTLRVTGESTSRSSLCSVPIW